MDFAFTNEGNRFDEVVDYLRGPRLWIPRIDYPDFDRWAEKVHRQLKSEEKRALWALSHDDVVGVVIYQRHKRMGGALEIKNITVRPDMRGRFIASFLFRNAEIEGSRDYGVQEVLVDAKVSNVAIRSFLLGQGYRRRGVADLYRLGAGLDAVYGKVLRRVRR